MSREAAQPRRLPRDRGDVEKGPRDRRQYALPKVLFFDAVVIVDFASSEDRERV